MTDERLLKLIKYVVEHSRRESVLLTPQPAWFIGTIELFDGMREIYDISEEEMTRLVDDAGDALAAADEAREALEEEKKKGK